jgi:solute carrier family 13 (sodium-dependent dicarboxylate transporter), member 2/3/5
MSDDAKGDTGFDVKRLVFLLLGPAIFCAIYFSPAWPDAVDPNGQHFILTPQGKAALALFGLAATWWVTEVVPIGVTSITIGIVQAMFFIRPDIMPVPPEMVGTDIDWEQIKPIKGAWRSFTDFLAPSVWFIFGSLSFGMVFTKTGLTKRMAYKMLSIVGERTSMIYLGCFVLTSALTLIMAHTAVAATIYPLLVAIYALYTDDPKPTKFGKGLFMGMAFVAGAGSIITLLGAARGAVALGFYTQITGETVGFFELAYYMFPIGALMTFLLWGFFMVWYKPEQATIPGLKERSKVLYAELGRIRAQEVLALVIVGGSILALAARSFLPDGNVLKDIDKAAIILLATVLFFVFKILKLEDLESTSWNIILLFGGAMSIGYCLWQTGAASWLAINWLAMFADAPGWVFVISIAFFVMIMTNLIMNVAAIAISMPVALVIAPYLNVAPEVVVFSSLVTAGMPFLLLVGAAPNAIAYASKQFTSKEFFITGIPASILLMIVVTIFVLVVWPLMGMSVSAGG